MKLTPDPYDYDWRAPWLDDEPEDHDGGYFDDEDSHDRTLD